MGDENFEKLYNNLSLELSKFLIKVKTCISLSKDIEETTKQRCRQWINKLFDYSDLNVSTLNNHISYAKLLLDMLLKNKFDHPFTEDPPTSPLPPLIDDYAFSANIDAVFSEELDKYFINSKLEDSMNNLNSQDSKIMKDLDLDKLNSIFTAKQQELEKLIFKSESPTKLKNNKIEKLENKIFLMKDKFRQKLIAMENIHELKLKQVMARKNAEMDLQMEAYEEKLLQSEAEKRSLVIKYQNEIKQLMEGKEREIFKMKERHTSELKKGEELISDTLMKRYKDDCHQLEQKHQNYLKELKEEKDAKIKELSDRMNQQMQANVHKTNELENNIRGLNIENKMIDHKKKECEGLNESLRKELQKLKDEIDTCKTNSSSQESELKHLRSDHKLEVKTLKYQSETFIDALKQKHLSSSAKSSERINCLEKLLESKDDQMRLLEKEKESVEKLSAKVIYLERSLEVKDEEIRTISEGNTLQLKELNEMHAEKYQLMEYKHTQELEEIKKIFLDKLKCHEDDNQALRNELGNKNKAISSLNDNLEMTTERLKNIEEELKNEKEELLVKISSLEKELSDVRLSQQKVERSQINKIKKLQEQLAEQTSSQAQKFDAQKKELLVTMATSREGFRKEKEMLVKKYEKSMMEVESKCNQKLERDLKIREMMESRIKRLENERDEAMKNVRKEINEHERRKNEEIKSLRFQHQFEMDASNKKSMHELEMLNDQYRNMNKKLAESHFLKIKKLELSLESQILESEKIIKQMSDKLLSAEQKNAEQMITFNDKLELMEERFRNEKELLNAQILDHLHKINKLKNQLLEKEAKLKECHKQYEEQMSLLKCEHIENMKTMIPFSVKQDLEKAIDALRSQVASLKERIQLLERH